MIGAHARLGDIATVIRGVTFKPEDRLPVGSQAATVCFRTANIQGQLDTTDLVAVPRDLVRQDQYVREGDILVSSANSWNLVGRCVMVPHLNYGACAGGFISILRHRPDKVDADYLFRWLSSPKIQADVRNCANKTTSIANLSFPRFLELSVPLPPIIEQRRIADLLARADAVRRKREESRRLMDELLRSVFLEMFGDPVRNEKGWEVVRLQEVSTRIQIGPFGSLLHDSDYINGGVPLINPMHIRNGRIEVDEHRTVSHRKAQALESYRVASGEVILGRRGEMGRCAIIEPKHSGFLIGTGSLVIRPDSELLFPEFLEATLSSTATRGYLDGATQGATMPNLNRKIVAGLPIALPPMAEQRRFVGLRTQLLASCDRHDSALRGAVELSKAIESSCLGSRG